MKYSIPSALVGILTLSAFGQSPVPPSVEEQLQLFTLPEGFHIELIASEEHGLINPMDITFDDAGRAWTQTASMYPLDPLGSDIDFGELVKIVGQDSKEEQDANPEYKRIRDLYQLKTRGEDKVFVINDPTKPVEGQLHAFADGLTIPQSVLPYKDGVFIAHGHEMLFFNDADGDGVSDEHKTVLTGFGFNDTHTMVHTLVRGPGGWVHFSQGALNNGMVEAVASGEKERIEYSKLARFSLDGDQIELVSSGLNNIWGYQLDATGSWYGTEANDLGFSVIPLDPMSSLPGIGRHKFRDYQPFMAPPHAFRVGSTSISGLAISDDQAHAFPEEWRNVNFLANPRTNAINTVRMTRDASGKIVGTHLPDLLKTTDEWFRPVNIEFGPDGALYIVDFCNKVIGHNGVPQDNPNRDKKHGRLWRVTYKGAHKTAPNVAAASDADLLIHLQGDTRWEQRAAWHQIADRQAVALLPQLKAMVLDPAQSISTRVHALWSYESLGAFDPDFTRQVCASQDHNLRREALRTLHSFSPTTAQALSLLRPLVEDPHHEVRAQVLRTIGRLKTPHLDYVRLLVTASKPLLSAEMVTGGPYERAFERYLARKALEDQAQPLAAFLASEEASTYPLENILGAIQALPKEQFGPLFRKFWEASGKTELSADIFVTVGNNMGNKDVVAAVTPIFQNPANHASLLQMVLDNRETMSVHAMIGLLQPALTNVYNKGERSDRLLAVESALTFKSPQLLPQMHAMLAGGIDAALYPQALAMCLQFPAQSEAAVLALTQRTDLPSSQAFSAVETYNLINPQAGQALIAQRMQEGAMGSTSNVITKLSYSLPGAQALVALVEQGLLSVDQFDIDSASRLEFLLPELEAAKPLIQHGKQLYHQQRAHNRQQIAKYTEAYATLEGNPMIGKAIFGSCTVCHAVGDTGHHIAPPLDGSASRELEDILTAVVDPDAAMEIGYGLHRVLRKDGTLVEGYLESRVPQGMVIKNMGNMKTFVHGSTIKKATEVRGKSFMPSNFSNLPEQTMVDLVTYIKSLK